MGPPAGATVPANHDGEKPGDVPGDRKYGHVMKCEDQRSGAGPPSVHFGTLEPFVHKDAPLFNVPQLAGHKALARELKVEAQAR